MPIRVGLLPHRGDILLQRQHLAVESLERQSCDPVGPMKQVKDLVGSMNDQIHHLPSQILLDRVAQVIDGDTAI